MTETIFDAIASVSVFAVPMFAVAALEHRKAEKKRIRKEFEEIRRRDYLYGFKAGMGYQSTCNTESIRNGLKRNAQQVDKEWDRYERLVG